MHCHTIVVVSVSQVFRYVWSALYRFHQETTVPTLVDSLAARGTLRGF